MQNQQVNPAASMSAPSNPNMMNGQQRPIGPPQPQGHFQRNQMATPQGQQGAIGGNQSGVIYGQGGQQGHPQQQIMNQQQGGQPNQQQNISQQQQQQQASSQHAAQETYVDPKQLIHSIYEKGNIGYSECDEELLKIAPEFELLNQLVKYEGMIDKMVKRKRFDLQEQFARPNQKTKQIFRMYITNDYHQISQGPHIDNDPMQIEQESQYQWNLKIYGHLLQEDKTNASYLTTPKQYFSNFFSKITVEFKDPLFQSEPVQWRKSDKVEQGIIIRKQSSKETVVTIHIHLYHNPLKFRVDHKLASIIGFEICTRSTALAAIWEYIKLKNLQDSENKSEINCDDAMRSVFLQDKINIGQITAKLRQLLTIPNQTSIRHQIKLSGTPEENERVYDFVVDVDSQLGMEIMPFFSQKVVLQEKKDSQKHPFITLNQKIKDLDKKFTETLEKIKSHKFKRDSYFAYTLDPSLYIENTILQQNIYLQMMKEDKQNPIDDPTSLQYMMDNEDLVEREIKRYLDNLDGIKGEREFELYQQEMLNNQNTYDATSNANQSQQQL
ncbi:hypothetical protein ABPG72_001782 [Tetrahymena utriculariae]